MSEREKVPLKVALIGANGQLAFDLSRTKPAIVEIIPLTRDDFDLRDQHLMKKFLLDIKPDIIINTAAVHKVDILEEDKSVAFEVNTIAVANLAHICSLLGAKLVHISTDYVFSGEKFYKKEPYYEFDQPSPINIYGLSKYAGELAIKAYTSNFIIARVSSLFGVAGASGKGGNFVYTILNKAKEFEKSGESLKVVADVFMTPTYTKDAAVVIWKLLINDERGIFHVSNSGICSWWEFAVEIVKLAGIDVNVDRLSSGEYPSKARRPVWSPLASARGVKMRHWKEALVDFLDEVYKMKKF